MGLRDAGLEGAEPKGAEPEEAGLATGSTLESRPVLMCKRPIEMEKRRHSNCTNS